MVGKKNSEHDKERGGEGVWVYLDCGEWDLGRGEGKWETSSDKQERIRSKIVESDRALRLANQRASMHGILERRRKGGRICRGWADSKKKKKAQL